MPTITALEPFSRFCPSRPTSGRMRWRLYRLISSWVSSPDMAAGPIRGLGKAPPATLGTMITVSPSFTDVRSPFRYRMSSSLT